MKPRLLNRRHTLTLLAAGTLAGLAPTLAAAAEAWPTKAVRIIVPYAPGGTSDAVARLFAERLQTALGQPFVVENKPGASGTTGMDVVAKAAPDGHTLAFAAVSPLTLNPHLQPKIPYDPLKDVAPVAQVMYSPVYVGATSAFSGKSFADAIAQAKAKPGHIAMASSGMGSIGHIMAEQIARKAGVPQMFNHIPYKGSGLVTNDAIAGQFELFTANPSPALNAQISNGKLRVLAVGAPQRLPHLPEVPTLAELGYADANMTSLFGLFANGRTPREVQAKINAEVGKLLAAKDVQERLSGLDNVVSPASVEAFAARVKREHDANARLVREAGIKAD